MCVPQSFPAEVILREFSPFPLFATHLVLAAGVWERKREHSAQKAADSVLMVMWCWRERNVGGLVWRIDTWQQKRFFRVCFVGIRAYLVDFPPVSRVKLFVLEHGCK